MSYLTDDEITELQIGGISNITPYVIQGVMHTQFSVARYFGACKFNGHTYTYFPSTDELIRDDVLKLVTKWRKPSKPKAVVGALADQGNLI